MLFHPTGEKSNPFGSGDEVMVCRTPHEEFDPKCTIPTVKHGDGLGLFHPSGSWKTVCIRSHQGRILVSR